VLITKTNVNGEINSCIIDGRLYKNKLNVELMLLSLLFRPKYSVQQTSSTSYLDLGFVGCDTSSVKGDTDDSVEPAASAICPEDWSSRSE
jgi:hypothetical protein